MLPGTETPSGEPKNVRPRAADFLELTKPGITVLVTATTLAAFYLATPAELPLLLLLHTLAGTALVAGGAGAFNMYLERNLDGLMRRTARRPIPSGRLQSGEALVFALLMSCLGMVYLFFLVNPLASLLSALTFVSYLFLYTPMKTRTWLCTLVGALPGALPTTIGWSAAAGTLGPGAWAIFGIVFFWQVPHFYAIGWMHREDYARAGFPMLPVLDASGRRTSRQANLFIAALMTVSVLPALVGLSGLAYVAGAVLLGAVFLACGMLFALRPERASARRLFFASIGYLPLILCLLVFDKST